jgi:hypothetical protein
VCGRPRALDRDIVFALLALIDEERHAAFGAVNENDGYRAVREVASTAGRKFVPGWVGARQLAWLEEWERGGGDE